MLSGSSADEAVRVGAGTVDTASADGRAPKAIGNVPGW